MKNKFNKKRIWFIVSIFLFVISLIFCIATEVDARAGSGNYYSGGSRSSGSSSGSSSGDAELVYYLIKLIYYLLRLCWEAPIIGIPLLIFVCFIIYMVYKAGTREMQSQVISRGSQNFARQNNEKTIRDIKAVDPDFNVQEFSNRVKVAFKKVQEAWARRDLSTVEAFLSDGTYEQFSVQIEDYKPRHIIDYMEGLEIKNVALFHYESDGTFSTIDVEIVASAVNYRKDDRTEKLIDGSKYPEAFSEVWTFVKKTGTKSYNKQGLIEGQCPNCGNPIETGRLTKCKACGSILRSGEFDWVLTKITQRSEWKAGTSANKINGYNNYKAKDEGFTAQHIEDIATVMFWRKIISERAGDFSYMRKTATDELTNKTKAEYEKTKEYYKDTGLAAVSLKAVTSREESDLAVVSVIWGGVCAHNAFNKEEIVRGYKNYKDFYVLTRKSGVQTNSSNALNSAHCPNCGAPETGTDNECPYCGTVLNTGEKEWVLSSIENGLTPELTRLINSIANEQKINTDNTDNQQQNLQRKNQKKSENSISNVRKNMSGNETIRWSIAMMLADGIIEPKEMEYLNSLAREYGMTSKLNSLITEISSQQDPVSYVMSTTEVSNPEEILTCLLIMAMADGRVTKEENAMLKSFAARVGISPSDYKAMAEKIKKRLYKDSLNNMFHRNN